MSKGTGTGTGLKRTAILKQSPRWGTGVGRRRIGMSASEGRVDGALEDHRHAMRCTLFHESGIVTRVESDFHRYTLNLCPGAATPLQELVGLPVNIPPREFFAGGRARRNCTHMLDLAWLCLRQAARGMGERLYDVVIPDGADGTMTGVLLRDGAEVLRWDTDNGIITAPARYAGQATLAGFIGWVLGQPGLDDEELEAALVLQKGFFLTLGRQYDLPTGPVSETQRPFVADSCFGYASATLDHAVRRPDQFRDFTDRADDLLRFL